MRSVRYSVLAIFVLLAGACGNYRHTTIGGTELCYPKEYAPKFDLTIWLMTHIGQNLPHGDEELIYIPAAAVKAEIPNYSLSHPNQYTPAVMHDLTGIAMGPSSTRVDQSMRAWTIRQSGEKYLVEKDETNNIWRVYPMNHRSFMWDLVRSPPPETPSPLPPSNWYVASCLEMVGSYDCNQLVKVGNVRYEYELNQANLSLSSQVAEFVRKQLRDWQANCKKTYF